MDSSSTEPKEPRRYHDTAAPYVLPNDAIEHKRLDAQARAVVEMIGGEPFLAVNSDTQGISKAVDVGCGTGIATLQLASMFPSAKVWGIDISPVPEAVREVTPTNVEWVQGDVLGFDRSAPGFDKMSGEVFLPDNLDYIFSRALFLAIKDWPRYYSIAAKSLRSGGIIETIDADLGFHRMHTNERLSDGWEWHRELVKGAEKLGLLPTAGSQAASIMKSTGLEVIHVQTFPFAFVASSTVPKSQATADYVRADFLPNFPELVRKMVGVVGITGEKAEQLAQQAIVDSVSEEGIHMKFTVTIARKP